MNNVRKLINEIYQRTHEHCYDGAAAGNFLREVMQALVTPSQATPEGADLQPLPEPWIRDCTTKDPAARDHFAADQMRDYARDHEIHLMQSYAPLMDAASAKYRIEKAEAALAASQQATPQYTCERHKDEVKKGGACCWCQLEAASADSK